jgi:hypothetical protein
MCDAVAGCRAHCDCKIGSLAAMRITAHTSHASSQRLHSFTSFSRTLHHTLKPLCEFFGRLLAD